MSLLFLSSYFFILDYAAELIKIENLGTRRIKNFIIIVSGNVQKMACLLNSLMRCVNAITRTGKSRPPQPFRKHLFADLH